MKKLERENVMKKVVSLLLVLALFFSIVACGTANNETEKAETSEIVEDTKEAVEEPEIETEVGLKDNELFNEVYYKITNREYPYEKKAIINYLETTEFTFEVDKEFNDGPAMNILYIQDDSKENGDYVFIVFIEMEDEPSIDLLNSMSYYFEQEHIEVSFSNYATYKEPAYDNYRTHKIGEGREKVNSVEEQIVFIEENIN